MVYKIKILSNLLGIIIPLYVMQKFHVCANQIENCHSNMFLDISNSRYTKYDLYDTSDISIDRNNNAIKEEIKLFDWEELLIGTLHERVDGVLMNPELLSVGARKSWEFIVVFHIVFHSIDSSKRAQHVATAFS